MSEEQEEEYEADELDRKWWFVRGMRNVYDPGTTPLERYRQGLMGPIAPIYKYDVLWLYEMTMRLRYLFGRSPDVSASPGERLQALKDEIGADPAGLSKCRISSTDVVFIRQKYDDPRSTLYNILSKCISAISPFVNGTACLIDPDYGDHGVVEQDFGGIKKIPLRAKMSGTVGGAVEADSSDMDRSDIFTFSAAPYKFLSRLRYADPVEASATLRDQERDPGEPTTDFEVKRPPYFEWLGLPEPENMYVTFKNPPVPLPDKILSRKAVHSAEVLPYYRYSSLFYPVYGELDLFRLAHNVISLSFFDSNDEYPDVGFDLPSYAVHVSDPREIDFSDPDQYSQNRWTIQHGIDFTIAPQAEMTVSPPEGWLDAWPEQFSSVVNAMHIPGLGGPLDLVMRNDSETRYETGSMDLTESWSTTSPGLHGGNFSLFDRAGMRCTPLYSAYIAYICGILDSVITKKIILFPGQGEFLVRFRSSCKSSSTYRSDWGNSNESSKDRYYIRDIIKEADVDVVDSSSPGGCSMRFQNDMYTKSSVVNFADGTISGSCGIGMSFNTVPTSESSSVFTNSVEIKYSNTSIDDYTRFSSQNFSAKWSVTASFDVALVNRVAVREAYPSEEGFLTYGGWTSKSTVQTRFDTEDHPTTTDNYYGSQYSSIPSGIMNNPDFAYIPDSMAEFYSADDMRVYAVIHARAGAVPVHKVDVSGSYEGTISFLPVTHFVDAVKVASYRLEQVSIGRSGRFTLDPVSEFDKLVESIGDTLSIDSFITPISGASEVVETHDDGKIFFTAKAEISSVCSNLIMSSQGITPLLYHTDGALNEFETGFYPSQIPGGPHNARVFVEGVLVTLGLKEESVLGFLHDCPAFDPAKSE